MSKKGFTLMEMLGVIIILATILAIAMPKITDTIYEAQYKAFTNDVNELHGITKLEYNNKNEYRTYYFEDGKQVNIEEVGKLDFKGDNPGRGYIEIYQNGDIEFELVSKNGKFCASKSINEEKAVIQRCNKINTSEKFTLKTSYISTTNSILVTLIPKNGEKDVVITDYYYRLDNGKIINSSKANHLFKKLKNTDENGNAKKYNITVKACSKSGTCKEEKINATMQLIGDIKYTITKIPDLEDTDWAKEKTITFEYPDLKDIEGNSIGINEISTDGKTFTKYTGEITVKEDTTFVARVSDGTNSITSASIKVIKFDYEAPTITNVSGNPSNWTNKNVTIVVNGASDNGKSGLAEKAYSFDEGKTWQKENSKTYTSNGKVVIKVKDKLDNIYTQTFDITYIDKVKPTCTSSGGNSNWTKDSVTLVGYCSDSESGCTGNAIRKITDEMNSTTESPGMVYDNVGNSTKCPSNQLVRIDKTGPSAPTTMNFVFSNWSGYSNNSWTNQDVYAGRTKESPGPTGSTDNLSGICKYQISSDGSNYRDYAYNLNDSMYYMSTTGTHTRYFRAVDCAGNVGNAISRVARIDKIRPIVSYSPSGLGSNSSNRGLNIKITASDENFDKMNIHVYKNWVNIVPQNNIKTSSYEISLPAEEGEYQVFTNAYDKAGNIQIEAANEGGWYLKIYKYSSATSKGSCKEYNSCASAGCAKYNYRYEGANYPNTCGSKGGYPVNDSYCKNGRVSYCCAIPTTCKKYKTSAACGCKTYNYSTTYTWQEI